MTDKPEITDYQSSRGPIPIKGMPFTHLANAIVKLADCCPPHRADELAAMRANLAEREAAYQAAQIAVEQTVEYDA